MIDTTATVTPSPLLPFSHPDRASRTGKSPRNLSLFNLSFSSLLLFYVRHDRCGGTRLSVDWSYALARRLSIHLSYVWRYLTIASRKRRIGIIIVLYTDIVSLSGVYTPHFDSRFPSHSNQTTSSSRSPFKNLSQGILILTPVPILPFVSLIF